MRVIRQLIVLVACLVWAVPSGAAGTPTIAAAADLKFALSEIAAAFKAETGQDVKLVFGSSGTFRTQIEQGAPFDIFFSADEAYVFALADQGLTRDRGTLYGIGRIVLFVPNGVPIVADGALDDLRRAVHDGRLRHLAIANPAHAPYGRAARAALQAVGIWQAIEPLLVTGENAAQAMQFAASGAAQGGILPLALAKSPALAGRGQSALIPAELHASEPLRQRMVLLNTAGPVATQFAAYVGRPAARAILERYGFGMPSAIEP